MSKRLSITTDDSEGPLINGVPPDFCGTLKVSDALDQLLGDLARADARIAELERECSQWRDELRIYRETENKRIAELEQSVTVRDTEIARLETDLELARRDAERYRWLRDSDNEGPISAGNATAFGEYGFERVEWFYDDELDAAVDEARAGNGGGV